MRSCRLPRPGSDYNINWVAGIARVLTKRNIELQYSAMMGVNGETSIRPACYSGGADNGVSVQQHNCKRAVVSRHQRREERGPRCPSYARQTEPANWCRASSDQRSVLHVVAVAPTIKPYMPAITGRGWVVRFPLRTHCACNRMLLSQCHAALPLHSTASFEKAG